MGRTVNIRVDKSLEDQLKRFQRELVKNMVGVFGEIHGDDIDIPTTITSRLIAAKLAGEKEVGFKIKKMQGMKKQGIIQFL